MPAHYLKSFLLLAVILFLDRPAGGAWASNIRADGDPYKILGVKRTASDDEIHQAYRKRAKETHPDKNSSPKATDEFRRVTSAFKILGDPVSRKRYDRAIYEEANKRRRAQSRSHQRQQHHHQQQRQQQQSSSRKPNDMDTRKERQMRHTEMIHKSRSTQSRMTKIITKEEFETNMLDASKKFYKINCLIMFVANKNAEKWAETYLYFQFPFAGDGRHGNSYENLLLVSKVRFNAQTDLTRLFRAETNSNTPHIIFARKGDAVRNFQVFNTKKLEGIIDNNTNGGAHHREFQKWVESQLVFPVVVVNRHALPVEVRVMRDGRTVYGESSLNPNYELAFALHVGDRILAYDIRVDTFPGAVRNDDIIANTRGVLLLDVMVTSGHESYTIPARRCYDLSTQCNIWVISSRRGQKTGNNQCHINPEYMHHICPYTCGVCTEYFTSDISYLTFHRPIHSFPIFLQGLVRFGRDLLADITDMARQRMTVAVTLFSVGLLMAFNIASSVQTSKMHQPNQYLNEVSGGIILDFGLFLCAGAMAAWMAWITSVTTAEVPPFFRSIHSDMIGVANFTDMFILIICVGVIAGVYIRSFISCSLQGNLNVDSLVFFILILLTISCIIFAAHFLMLSVNELLDSQWYHTWKYHKEAVSVVVFISACIGVGVISMERLIVRPIVKNLSLLACLSNVIVLAVVGFLTTMDPHFIAHMMNAIQYEKNAAIVFVLFGMITGHVLGDLLDE